VRPRTVLAVVVGIAVVLFPWLPGVRESLVVHANLAWEYALIAVSLVILTGWVGQISLAQGSFVGIGAFATGLLIRGGVPFPVNLPLVAAITAVVAALLGFVALRVRGLYLAVATLIFAYVTQTFLFSQSWLVGEGGASSISPPRIGRKGTLMYFDLSSAGVRYLVILAALAAAVLAARHIRRSKTGRAFLAVRGSEMAAVSLGIDVTRYKLLAFAISGALAGLAGNLTMIDLGTVSPSSFQFTASLFYLSIAVVGGISSLGGAVAAGILFGGLHELFLRVQALNGYLDIVSVGLLLVVLLAYPGGLGALGPMITTVLASARRAVTGWMRRPLGADAEAAAPAGAASESETETTSPRARAAERRAAMRNLLPFGRRTATIRRTIDLSRLDRLEPEPPSVDEILERDRVMAEHRDWRRIPQGRFALPPDRENRAPVLVAESVTVRFGGLLAVADVSLAVREGEIVGLIGPNGAGKTTTFNAIAGLNAPASGTIALFGEDATAYPVHVRAQMGVGRTFQLIQLFPQLSVFDNLLVATHVHNGTGVFSHVLVTERAIAAERDARRRVRQVVALMGLEDVVDRRIAGLPFGVLRHVEIARALVTEAPLLMLDEPASGLDNAETDELAALLRFIRSELGVTILLIEHDVRMVTSVSDYMYVLDGGRLLAEGAPSEIQRNPAVIAAYLGEASTPAEVEAV
jgi:ABC-type branched-subunit amino acid transport system ATPase component/ABC-type branched-subunit amino acid transport system permease subunit